MTSAAMVSDMALTDWLDDADGRDWETATDGSVRFALIGLGWWTVDFAIPAIERAARCETTVLVSSTAEKARRIADEHDIPHGISYDAFHEGAAAEDYDAIYIGTPNARHEAFATTAAALDKAVLCEKPIAADYEAAERMVEACADVPFMAAYRMQTDPIVRRARELLRDGIVGEPRYVSGTNAQPLLEMIPDSDQWRLNPELTGHGTSVMDLGIYIVNTARFLLESDPVEATARMASVDEAFAGVPDQWASFSLGFEDGVSLVGTTSQDAQRETRLAITGSEGRLVLDPVFHGEVVMRIERGDATATVEHDAVDGHREMYEEFAYFADRMLSGEPIGPDGEHALVDMATLAAIHEAAERGEPVRIA